jgi:hypothetical protein
MRNRRDLLKAAALAALPLRPAKSQTVVNGRPSVVLEGQVARVVVDIGGGGIVAFQFRDQELSPLHWEEPGGATAPRPMGHFLCLDRWGPPTETEKRNGMTFHGEAARVKWSVLRTPAKEGGMIRAGMAAELPLAGLKLKRDIRLSDTKALFLVSEAVTNANKLGRIYNMVQHATIGPPFLDETTLVDSNARKGFMQSSPMPNPEAPAVYWPQALQEARPVDLRHLTDNPLPNVVSYTIDEEHGWVAASNASKRLLIGYIWRTKDYPWFNAWRDVRDGKPFARGLEFGTTGLHQPFPVLVAKGRIFGRSIYVFLDSGETVTRSYAAFLFKIPPDYGGVARVTYAAGRLVLREQGAGPGRSLVLETGELFPG